MIQKLKKGQYGVPFSFGRSSREIWHHVLTAQVQQNPFKLFQNFATKPIDFLVVEVLERILLEPSVAELLRVTRTRIIAVNSRRDQDARFRIILRKTDDAADLRSEGRDKSFDCDTRSAINSGMKLFIHQAPCQRNSVRL